MRILRQSTAITIQIGPFLDALDGVTPKTALTPTPELAKGGGAFGARSGSSVVHNADGWYAIGLDATDTNSVGALIVKDLQTGCIPVWHEFMVMAQAAYDALYGSGAMPASVTQIQSSALDAILDQPIVESTVFSWPGSLRKILSWLGVLSRNKILQTATTQTVRNAADSATLGTATHSDDGTTHTRGGLS